MSGWMTQAGIKIAGKNINKFRYVDDTSLMAESKEELKSLLMKVKDKSEKAGLKFNIPKTKTMASGLSLHGKWRNNGNSGRLYLHGLQTLHMVTVAMKLKDACSLEEKL